MNFMFSWQEQYLTRSLRSLVRYCSCHENIKFISSRHRVISSIYHGDNPNIRNGALTVSVPDYGSWSNPTYESTSTWFAFDPSHDMEMRSFVYFPKTHDDVIEIPRKLTSWYEKENNDNHRRSSWGDNQKEFYWTSIKKSLKEKYDLFVFLLKKAFWLKYSVK